MRVTIVVAFLICLVGVGVAYSKDQTFTVTNEMIYQKLLEIEKKQAVLEAQFREFKDQVDKRFEQLYTFLWIITSIFTALVVAVIGFAYWDRRTIIRKARDEAFNKVEM